MYARTSYMQPVHLPHVICIIACVFTLVACGEYDKSAICSVLDARDTAVSQHDINAYSDLLLPGYEYQQQTEFEIIDRMRKLFGQFEKIDMASSNRTIRLLDQSHAECEQSYVLRVQVDHTWRQINQRERISLTKTASGWKISGGL